MRASISITEAKKFPKGHICLRKEKKKRKSTTLEPILLCPWTGRSFSFTKLIDYKVRCSTTANAHTTSLQTIVHTA